MTSEGLFNEINVSLKNAIVDSTAKLYAAYELSLSDVERINKNFIMAQLSRQKFDVFIMN